MHQLISSLLIVIAALTAPFAQSAEVPYDHAAFETALKVGAPVAVVFHADWCPTCRAQAPILKQLTIEPGYKNITLFIADFDKELPLRQELHVTKQSTIVVFNKGREVNRSTGETQRAGLAAVLASAGSGI